MHKTTRSRFGFMWPAPTKAVTGLWYHTILGYGMRMNNVVTVVLLFPPHSIVTAKIDFLYLVLWTQAYGVDKSQPTPTLLLATVYINASKYEVTAKSFGRYNGDHHIPIADLPINSPSRQMSEIRTHWLWYPPTALSSMPHCHQGESALGRVPGITSYDCWPVIVSV